MESNTNETNLNVIDLKQNKEEKQFNKKSKKEKKKEKNNKKENNQKTPEDTEARKEKEDNRYKSYLDYTRDLKSEKFNFYYKNQLKQYFKGDEEFEIFLEKLREKLPCVFRINPSNIFHKEFKQILNEPNFLKNFQKENEASDDLALNETKTQNNNENENEKDKPNKILLESIKINPFNLCNIPKMQNMIYNINIPRFDLKRNSSLANFHNFIMKSVGSGLISRQEAVSMIPPILTEILPGEKVFDSCAAPGSKTAQLLEEFYRDFDFLDPKAVTNDKGVILANDNNPKRAHMMCYQLKRLNTTGMMIISHDAQHFPTIIKQDGDKFLFDKILCDVPCSSDAVMRKLPHKWKTWSPRDSFSLHKLQLQIVKRSVNLLKDGGRLVYSTCSLNPIENEAVVSELMRIYKDKLEILDMGSYFTGSDIRIREGLTSWKVYTEDKENNKELIEIPSKDHPLYQLNKNIIEESCFPDDEKINKEVYKLDNCIRLFPHDNDTSGFFITIFQKKSVGKNNIPEKNKNKDKLMQEEKGLFFMEDYPLILNSIKDFFGLSVDFPFNQLVTHSKIQKKLNLVSKGLYDLLKNDSRNQIKILAVGVKLFTVNKKLHEKDKTEETCNYRVCQDGLIYVLPFMRKRIFYVGLDFFKKILKLTDYKYADIESEEMVNTLKNITFGCVVLILIKDFEGLGLTQKEICELSTGEYLEFLRKNYLDSLSCYNSQYRISTMINKEHQHVFNLKYEIE